MDSKEIATSCSVCQEIYTDPRSLACGHSFCLKCLKGVAGNKKKFPCPICRFDIDLGHTNVDQLPKNFGLSNVIEVIDTEHQSMCSDHKKLLDLFCQGCHVVICSKCLTMQHKDHEVEDIEQIYSERNKELESFLDTTKQLASKIQDKIDAVKQSRILMEKNIDSINERVESTFKKWNDALQKQQNAIVSYVHEERDQKRQVFVEAERILACSMTTVTGLDTDINNLRSNDAVLVVQQYGSIKARQEDTERKILQEIETCFTQPDTLVLEVYAPWIEEDINNITHIDMKQTKAKPGPEKIAEIQEEKYILQSKCKKLRNTLQELEKRLSEDAEALLTFENASIFDLSDPNIPTKLSKMYSDIYAKQWMDAFENLADGVPNIAEEEIFEYLYGMLVDGYRFCEDVRQTQKSSLEDILFDPAGHMKTSPRRQKEGISTVFTEHLSDVVKLSGHKSSAYVAKAFVMDKKTKDKYGEMIKLCETYIQECVQLCWLMLVQTPPLCLDLKTIQGQMFDKNCYKQYLTKGETIEFVIWPALFLHDNGPLLSKGVAQCE